MARRHSFLLSMLFLVCGPRLLAAQLHKLCLDNYNIDACQQVERDNEVTCQFVASKTDCILDADEGLPTISVLKPEEALLGAALVTAQAVVIGEIVPENPPYQTAVIVKSGYLGGFEPLRGLKYCHPGYDHDELVTTYVLEELEWKAISLSCNVNKTLTEQKFEALSLHFASSCRPGKWTADDDLDKRLKNLYPSLCELCGRDKCNTRYTVPFNNTLTCLTENGGDVALTTLGYANTFFTIGTNAQNFQFLCPNGTLAPVTNPCTWTNQLNRIILSSSASASIMKSYLETKAPSYVNGSTAGSASTSETSLARLLGLSRTDTINLINPTPLSNFVLARRKIPAVNESIQCQLTVNWSVTNDHEWAKCRWLQQASLNAGLQPVISCVSSNDNDTVSNLDNIKNGNADVAFADANFGYIARKKKLTNVAYPETDARRLSRIVIVVKNDTTWYRGFSDLKGKRACLPEYGGKEWLAFIDVLRNNRIFDNSASCDYGALFSDFVGTSCAPGAQSKDLGIPNTNQEKLCENCVPVTATSTAKYCNADINNKYYHSFGALTCLNDDNGDFAVIALNDLPDMYLRDLEAHQIYKVISKNGSLASYSGFQVDEESPIIIIIAGEVVIQNGSSKFSDVQLYLKELEWEFGQNLDKAFKVFERFDHDADLIFPDSTPGLTFGGTPNKYIENYKTLLSNSETCGTIPENTLATYTGCCIGEPSIANPMQILIPLILSPLFILEQTCIKLF